MRPFIKSGQVGAVRVATRPDAIDAEWLRRLRDVFGLATVELGVQSFDAGVLSVLGRSHSQSDVANAMHVLKSLQLRTSLHLMIGCPGERPEADFEALQQIRELRPDFVRIHPLLILKDTILERHWRAGLFKTLDLETAVDRAAWLTRELESNGVGVIRLGLQPNELLGESVVAGPYHPAFGDLVRGRMLRSRVAHLIQGAFEAGPGGPPSKQLKAVIESPEQLSGALKGPKKTNLEWLRTRFDLSSVTVRVVQDAATNHGEIKVRLHHITGSA
ncbi:MAG: hypothetical protein HY074_05640 [Deltaproteobacteria bacterium]|nr:hypothetical protein [Deltaproteobacteria bacterium]